MKYSKFLGVVLGAGLASAMAFSADAGPAKYKVVDMEIKQSLTGKPGNVAKGRKTVFNRKTGNCLACHAISDLSEQPFHGEVGPPLDGIGARASAGELRARLVDAKIFNPDTIMPSFHMLKTNNILKKWKGKTIVSAQDVEDMVAYLLTLKGVDEKKLEVLDKPAVQ